MAKRSFETLEEIQDDDDSETEQESEFEEEETESDNEVEPKGERRVMIRVVPRERFERRNLMHYSHSATTACSTGGGGGGAAAAAAAAASGGGGANLLCCQADNCGADFKDAKQYHRRHKVCEPHAKAAFVLVQGIRKRFCQQCSRFHEISEFDGTKRSCRDRLAGHNLRRRKVQSESEQQAEDVKRWPTSKMNSSSMVKMKAERHPKHAQLKLQGCSNTKHFPIR